MGRIVEEGPPLPFPKGGTFKNKQITTEKTRAELLSLVQSIQNTRAENTHGHTDTHAYTPKTPYTSLLEMGKKGERKGCTKSITAEAWQVFTLWA